MTIPGTTPTRPGLIAGIATALVLGHAGADDPPAPPSPVELEIAEDTSLEVEAFWDHIVDSTYRLHEDAACAALFEKLEPAQQSHLYGGADFQSLMPAKPVKVGDVWRMKDAALAFLRQFHPSATTNLHHGTGAGGGYACLRALTGTRAEVMFRFHAEFLLRSDVHYTPAQFEGRVWIDRETQSVDAFQLALPSRNTNVDINVHTRADIGFVPRMELVGGDPHGAREQAWESEISEAGARDTLARRFHRFAQIDWIPFDQALARAQETHRPLHVVVLFGTLDDESC
jgi:hypothetical protein